MTYHIILVVVMVGDFGLLPTNLVLQSGLVFLQQFLTPLFYNSNSFSLREQTLPAYHLRLQCQYQLHKNLMISSVFDYAYLFCNVIYTCSISFPCTCDRI